MLSHVSDFRNNQPIVHIFTYGFHCLLVYGIGDAMNSNKDWDLFLDWHFNNWKSYNATDEEVDFSKELYKRVYSHNHTSCVRDSEFHAWKAGAQSRQDEVDELNRKIAMYEKHVNAIKFIHENQFDKNSDTSWILGNLDGFFECLESDLKGE